MRGTRCFLLLAFCALNHAGAHAGALDDSSSCTALNEQIAIDVCLEKLEMNQTAPAKSATSPNKTPSKSPAAKAAEKAKELTSLEKELAVCAEMNETSRRLECFDGVTKKHKLEPQVTVGSTPGRWRVRTEQSKLDESLNVFLMAESNEVIPSPYSLGAPEHAILFLRCMENKTDVLIWFAGYSLYSEHRVTTRIDKQPAERLRWDKSNDDEYGFHPSPIRLIRALSKGQQFYVLTEPINHGPIDMTFDVRGLSEVLPKLQKACHWS